MSKWIRSRWQGMVLLFAGVRIFRRSAARIVAVFHFDGGHRRHGHRSDRRPRARRKGLHYEQSHRAAVECDHEFSRDSITPAP